MAVPIGKRKRLTVSKTIPQFSPNHRMTQDFINFKPPAIFHLTLMQAIGPTRKKHGPLLF